ncbi:MAG: gamma-butyrobetaine hydroxylase-like domain-containing protein [Rhodospirillaceae bacterium]
MTKPGPGFVPVLAMTVTASGSTTPTDVVLKRAEKQLHVAYDDGQSFDLPAEFLRVNSPSAEVQGHGPSQRKLVSGAQHVGLMSLEAVGNYAVRLIFDDLHDSGIYSWSFLRAIGEHQEVLWQSYLYELEQRGLSRDPKVRT